MWETNDCLWISLENILIYQCLKVSSFCDIVYSFNTDQLDSLVKEYIILAA